MRSDVYPNPADDPEAQKFLDTIAESKGDPVHRMIFADWLDEHGYANAAAGQRWAAKYNKRPLAYKPGDDNTPPVRGGWHFGGTREESSEVGSAEHYHLPTPFSFVKDQASNSYPHRVLTRQGGLTPQGGVENERDLLDASHMIRWDAETGKPLSPYE